MRAQTSKWLWLWIVACFALIVSVFWFGGEFLDLAQGYRIAIGCGVAAIVAGGGWYFTQGVGDD